MSLLVANRPQSVPLTGLFTSLIIMIVALLMTCSGAYNTRDLIFAHRLLLWATVAGLLVSQVVGLCLVAQRWLFPASSVWQSKIVAVFATIPLMALELHLLKFTPLLPKAPDPFLPFLFFVAPPVIILGGAVLWLLPDTRRGAPPLAAPVFEASSSVTWVRAHDHYLEIHTDSGKRFVRGVFTDYINGLKGGIQVHRSWWVAYHEVLRLERRERDYVIVLKDKTEIPVARSKIKAVRIRLTQR